MPYDEVVPGYALVRIKHASTEGTDKAFMIFGMQNSGSLPAAAVAEQVSDSWTASGGPITMISGLASLEEVSSVVNIGGVVTEGVYVSGATGGGGGAICQPQSAVLITKSTGVIGRQYQGRFYLPYWNPAALGTGTNLLTGATLTGWQAIVTAWYDDLVTRVGFPVLLHRATEKHPVPPAPTQILAFNVQQEIATQARRNRRRAHR